MADEKQIQCKMMKTMDPAKTEVILYFLFDTDQYTAEQLKTLAITLLSEKIGWSSPESFSQLLEDARVKPTHNPPSQLQ